MAKFFLVVEPSCLKKRILKPKCAVTNVDWNNLTFEFLAKVEKKFARDDLKLLEVVPGTTRNFRTFPALWFKVRVITMFMTLFFLKFYHNRQGLSTKATLK